MKKYVFKPYSNSFPQLFEKEKLRISSIRKDMIIEHVGSTAVPNLGGKGIIDIAIGVNIEQMDFVAKGLQALGYEFRAIWDTPDRRYFKMDLPDLEEGTRKYHIHVMDPESIEFKEMIFFRDYLRDHPDEAKTYGDLKRKAAEEIEENGEKYRKLKEPIFKKILAKRSKRSEKEENKCK